ncbi:DNA double-strand break repair nuclease NurA [Candidatus Bathyarchaeota archaeon]|nr:DNA double-strand break repair nuclease NurA [Candidatus Bathyarchaeota archaeon]
MRGGRRQVESDFPHNPPMTMNLRLCLEVRNLIFKELTSSVRDEGPRVRELASRVRRELEIFKTRKLEPYKEVSGADAGSQILPLASRRYAVVSALVYTLPHGERYFRAPELLILPYTIPNDRFEGTLSLRRESKLFETACSFIDDGWRPQLLLVDGPLAFSDLLSRFGRERDRSRLVVAVNGLLERCGENGIILAGVVKRSSSRHIIHHLGLQEETDLSDSFLLLHALRPGERTGLFSTRAERPRPMGSTPEAIRHPIYSFYGRFSEDWSIPPLRLDLPDFSLSHLEDVAGYCYSSSFWNGVPLPILKADEEVRISKRFMSEIYAEAVARIGRLTGEVSLLAPFWGEGRWMGIY